MPYQTTITKKGQITIPKIIREALKLKPSSKVIIDFEERTKEMKVKPVKDFLELAKEIKVRKKTNVLKAREYFEKHHERM